MKTYTIEELKLAQAKGCRIEVYDTMAKEWIIFFAPVELSACPANCRIHPADEWKARLPRLRDGAEWACQEFVPYEGHRPRVLGEIICYGPYKGLTACYGLNILTDEPVPPEFLHPDEIAKQTEAFTKGQKVSVDWHDQHGDGSYTGDGEFICHLAEGDVGDELLADGPHVVVKCAPDDSGSIFPLAAVKVIQQAAQAPDFGEPWSADTIWGDIICDNTGIRAIVEVFNHEINPLRRPRIIACVNALAGVPDPAEFVRQAKEAKVVLEELANMPEYDQDDAHRLRHKAKIALSKLQPFLP